MKEYTLAVHVKRLEKMLLRKDPCECCPAQPWFRPRMNLREMWPDGDYPCYICCRFAEAAELTCPCYYHGREEAIEITREKLSEYYREVER